MGTITVVFTKSKFSPVSYLIRWCLPRSRFHLARASHCLIADGDHFIDTVYPTGVRRLHKDEYKGLTIVAVRCYQVPDEDAGLAWARSQVGKPYDLRGAMGLVLAPDREWMEEDKWYCFELAAATLMAAGREAFHSSAGHITDAELLAIKP